LILGFLDGRVNTDCHVVETAFVEVVHASTTPSGLDPTGEVIEGEIKLRAVLKRGLVREPDNKTVYELDQQGGCTEFEWYVYDSFKRQGHYSYIPVATLYRQPFALLLSPILGRENTYERCALLTLHPPGDMRTNQPAIDNIRIAGHVSV
jgi:hypothetical protein